jgi:hypothetical protein
MRHIFLAAAIMVLGGMGFAQVNTPADAVPEKVRAKTTQAVR